MKNGMIISLFLSLFFQLNLFSQQRDLRFETSKAMYAANEEWLTFACEVPEGMEQLDLKHQSDMYWYSLYNLGNLSMRSGMGIHVVTSPLLKMHADNDKDKPWSKGMNSLMKQRKFLFHKVAQFKAKSGAANLDNMWSGYDPPKGAYPVYLEYASGIPTFSKEPKLEDFGTLRWDKGSFDKSMNPAAWGQTMMKQILWARDFFKESRLNNGITYIGTGAYDGAHGFRGSMLLALTMNKSFSLLKTLAYNSKAGKLGPINPMTYDPSVVPIYYPHKYEVKFKANLFMKMMGPLMGVKPPPIPKKFEVTDNSSNLFDIASLLWGASEFYYIADPESNAGFEKVFGDPMWIAKDKSEAEINKVLLNETKTILPADKAHMMSKGLMVVNFKNIKALHFNQSLGTMVDSWSPKTKQSDHISTLNAGMASIALANTYKRARGLEKIQMGAKKLLLAQADFLLAQQEGNGSIANGFELSSRAKADKTKKELTSQTSAMRAWLASYQVSKDQKYVDAAEKSYEYMVQNLWLDDIKVFKTTKTAARSTYDGIVYGSVVGALRELAIARKQSDRSYAEIASVLDDFFVTVKNTYGLQIAELAITGEMIPDKNQAKMMQDKIEDLKKTDPEKAKAMMAKMRDTDQDNVPKPKFVSGTKNGAAPVTAGSVTIPTKSLVHVRDGLESNIKTVSNEMPTTATANSEVVSSSSENLMSHVSNIPEFYASSSIESTDNNYTSGEKTTGEKLLTSTTGSITGKVKYEKGKVQKKINVIKDEHTCGSGDLIDESLLTDEDGGLKWAVVSITSEVQGGTSFNIEAEPEVLNQHSCTFEPHVLVVGKGQPLIIKNSDPTLHNVRTISFMNSAVNKLQVYIPNLPQPSDKVVFAESEVVTVVCDVHGWMKAYVHVVDNPYNQVTNENGNFSLGDVPPGKYDIKVWHEKLGEMTQTVTVKAGEDNPIVFLYK